jgi:preprotein translocase subunit SecA
VLEQVLEFAREALHQKLESFGDHWERVLSFIVLSVIDEKWKDHLYDLDHLRDSIRYRAYGQRDPLIEYKKEAYAMFVDLLDDMRRSVANLLFRAHVEPSMRLRPPEITGTSGPSDTIGTGVRAAQAPREVAPAPAARQPEFAATGVATAAAAAPDVMAPQPEVMRPAQPLAVEDEPGRNDPCPCGSGKKYKKCHGRVA